MEPLDKDYVINTYVKVDRLGREVRAILFISQFVFGLFHVSSRVLSKMFHAICRV